MCCCCSEKSIVTHNTAPILSNNNRRWISWREKENSPVCTVDVFWSFHGSVLYIFSHFLLLLLAFFLPIPPAQLCCCCCRFTSLYQHIWLPAMKREDDLIISIQIDWITFSTIPELPSLSFRARCHAFYHSCDRNETDIRAPHEASTTSCFNPKIAHFLDIQYYFLLF